MWNRFLVLLGNKIRYFAIVCARYFDEDDATQKDGKKLTVIPRNTVVLFLFIVLFVILIFIIRLISIIQQPKYKYYNYGKNSGRNNFSRQEIYDRNGEVLVKNMTTYDLYLQSSRMNDIRSNIKKIQNIFPNIVGKSEALLNKLEARKDNGKIVFIAKNLSLEQKQRLLDAEVEGLFFEEHAKRFYMHSSSNSLVGYCPDMNNCVSGIEKSMNSYLKTAENERLYLSVDIRIQDAIRELLLAKVQETKALGAVGLVMKIKTGELLAAVSLPDCDYNNYGSCSENEIFNRYSFGSYELGSIFKLFSAGLALKVGISPYKKYERRAYKIDENYTIHDLNEKEKSGGALDLFEMTKISSNVCYAKLMEDISTKDHISFFKELGLLDTLRTEITEVSKPRYQTKWNLINRVSMSYGYAIAVSPLQYVSALASLLKNAQIRPTFIKANEYDEEYNVEHKQYLSDEQMEFFHDILRKVITEGGGRKAYVDEYDVGGKTGTARQLKNGVYDKYTMVMSFVAVVPISSPEYVFFIMLEKPKVDYTNNYMMVASRVLGPIMKDIIISVGPFLGIKRIGG